MSLMIDGPQILSTKAERRTLYGGLTMWQFLDLKLVLEWAEQSFGSVLKVAFIFVKLIAETVEVIYTVDFTAPKNMMK